jgi:hypothetical protein
MGKKVKAHNKLLFPFQQTGTLNLNVPASQMFQLPIVSLRIFALLKRFALLNSLALPKIFSLNLFYNCKVLMKFVRQSACVRRFLAQILQTIRLQIFSYKTLFPCQSSTYCLIANSLRC